MTTGQLRAALVAQIMDYDPAAVIRRRKAAEKDARVETWTEPAGTGAVAGRDLPPADVLAADKTLTADARWLKAHGAGGTMDQLRARAFTARLTGQPLDSLLPAPGTHPNPAANPAGPGAGADGTGSAADDASTPGTPAVGVAAPGIDNTHASGGPASGGWPAGAGSSVNLTMPAAAWLGQTDTPGQISGLGAADAGTCRDLAATLARSPAATWCITLLGRDGRAVAHGCARAGPGPPGTDRAAWLATVTVTPIETGTCTHRRESAGYQPSDSLRHIIKIRSPRCGFPGCRRPALRCDDDHTIPYDQDGRTCECNLYPLCRRHHQTKQARGWQLSQPEPGRLIWTTPSGRQYITSPDRYPV
jgi:ribosomal protein L12E/L44/L45/RPP1/RPP2